VRYHVAHITTRFAEEWQKDIFEQQMGDLGIDTIDGDDYYLPSDVLEGARTQIETLCRETPGVTLLAIEACPDENWNAAWEAEHPVQELPLGIRIVPHCAFGAGHHETTSMMIEQLINYQSQISNIKSQISNNPFRVLDHGTGTGVLAIFAKRLGADYVLAIDIDEKSVENAKENAALNGEEIEVIRGDSIPPSSFQFSPFHLILANIHRNILLANMPAYAAALAPGGELWLSGFYEADCPVLQTAAESHGLRTTEVLENGEWRLMKCQNTAPQSGYAVP